MKKLFWALLSLSLLLTACSKEERIPSPEVKDQAQELFFYGVATPDAEINQQGVAQNNKLWHPNAVIRVKFLDDPYNMKEFVKTHAREWENHICPKFEFVEDGEAEVRIAFNWNNNRRITWSYTGNNCLFVTDQSKPTMNIAGWQSAAKTEEAKKGDVFRAFGQVLGLEYEYRHLAFNSMFDEYEAEGYWVYQQNIVSWNEMKRYVFDPLNASGVTQTDSYDAQSIMVVPFPDYVAGSSATAFNTELSAGDIAFIQQLYPPSLCEEEDEGAILTFKTTKQSIRIGLINDSEVTINWGDGTTAVGAISSSFQEYSHSYANSAEHIVKIYGSETSIKMFYSSYNDMTLLDISKCKMLKELDIRNNLRLPYLNVTKNAELEYLSYYGCREVGNVDISNCLKLISIECSATGLSSINLTKHLDLECFIARSNPLLETLDVTKNTKLTWLCFLGTSVSSISVRNCPNLRILRCNDTNISSLDLSQNPKLSELDCQNCSLTSLDVSICTNLGSIYCENNQITSLDVSNNNKLSNLYCQNNNITDIVIYNGGNTNSGLYNLNVSGNPIVLNQAKLTQLAQSLPIRSSVKGYITISNHTSAAWISSICTSLGWRVIY